MAYTFTDGTAKDPQEGRSIRDARQPGDLGRRLDSRGLAQEGRAIDEDKWELYHTDEDFTQVNDLAAKNPPKLKELQTLWRTEAKSTTCCRSTTAGTNATADPGRPVAVQSRKNQYTFYPGTSILHPLAAPQLLGKDHTITAHVEIPRTEPKACSPVAAASLAAGACSSRTASSTTSTITSSYGRKTCCLARRGFRGQTQP